MGGTQSTAITVSMDMTTGDHPPASGRCRFRAVRSSPVTSDGSVVQTMLTVLAVVAVAVLTGFRPTTGPIELAGRVRMS